MRLSHPLLRATLRVSVGVKIQAGQVVGLVSQVVIVA